MVIGIIGALEEEVNEIKKIMSNINVFEYYGKSLYVGEIETHKVILGQSSVGKVNAAFMSTLIIEKFAPDLIVNTGSAGALAGVLNIGDVVIGTKLTQHDINIEPYRERGTVEGLPLYLEPKKMYLDLIDSALSNLSFKHYFGGILSGDQFIHSQEIKDDLLKTFNESLCCEMEAAAIAHVCYLMKTDCLIIRSISDNAQEGASMDFLEFIKLASKNSALMVHEFLKLL